jgi:hypothetical protein
MWFTPAMIIEAWISVFFATGERAPITFASTVLVSVMNAPVSVCCGTVPLTHASFAVTSAFAASEAATMAKVRRTLGTRMNTDEHG